MGVLSIGSTALNAAYTQLQTTAHNIANVNTPGYTRQETVLEPAATQFGSGVFIGGGVQASDVKRSYNAHLTRELNSAAASLAESEVRSQSMARLEGLFADDEGGVGVLHDELRESLADLVNQPFDPAVRTVALARGEAFASRIDELDRALDGLRNDADLALEQEVSALNNDLRALADVNRRLATLQGNEVSPNDLLDQRDLLIERINHGIKATAHINQDETVTLFAGSGDALVLAEDAARVMVVSDVNDPEKLRLGVLTEDQPVPLNERMLGGGAVAGWLRFRNDDIDLARSKLGQYAAAVGSAYNSQQALGLDLDGNAGSAVFTIGQARSVGAVDNAGDAQFAIAIDDAGALRGSDYQLAFDGAQFTLTRLEDGEQQTFAALPQTVDGLTIDLGSGAVAAGDRYTLRTASAFSGGFELAMRSGDEWAASYAAMPVLSQFNEGSLSVGGFEVTAQDPNVAAPVSLVFTGPNTFDVSGAGTGNPTGVAYVPGQTFSFNGWEITLTGTPAAGDRIDVAAPTDPVADNRNARALLAIGETRLVDGQTPSEAFGALVGRIGSEVYSTNTDHRHAQIWHTNAKSARDEVSGVNLDEEAARLIQYQQAYQAAAKVIASAQSMFDAILTIMR